MKSNLKINAIDILKNMERLKKEAPIWKQTGGAHVAQIIYKDKYEWKDRLAHFLSNFENKNILLSFPGN